MILLLWSWWCDKTNGFFDESHQSGHTKDGSLSVPICSWYLVQLLLGLENDHSLFSLKSFSLTPHLNASVCCSSDTIANSFASLPTVTHNECHELSTCMKNWDLYEEESKILQKWICPVLMFSRIYIATKNVLESVPAKLLQM